MTRPDESMQDLPSDANEPVVDERLCRAVLGELSAEEATALEAELKQSADLRERLARLERSLAAVRALASDPLAPGNTESGLPVPTLSSDRRARLVAAASRPRLWLRRTWLRYASAAVVLIG